MIATGATGTEGTGVGVAVGVGLAVGVGDTVGDGVAVGNGDGVGVQLTSGASVGVTVWVGTIDGCDNGMDSVGVRIMVGVTGTDTTGFVVGISV